MGLVTEAIKRMFSRNTTNAASQSGARVPIVNVNGDPIGNDSLANFKSVLGGTIQGTITPDTYDSADQNGLYQVIGSSATNPILDWGRLFTVVQGVDHCLHIKYCANTKTIIIRYKYKTSSMSAAEWTAWSAVNVTALT